MEAPPRPAPAAWAAELLAAHAAAGLLRRPRQRVSGSDRHATIDGRSVVVFSSNDYLGLAVHPAVREGVGSTGSRHLSGCYVAIAAPEDELAAFEGSATATVAPSGFAANLWVLQALGGDDCAVVSDERNHASIIDGCRLSRGNVEVYTHRDLDDLEDRLARTNRRPIIVSDTVFSMDGTVADVAGLNGGARQRISAVTGDLGERSPAALMTPLAPRGRPGPPCRTTPSARCSPSARSDPSSWR